MKRAVQRRNPENGTGRHQSAFDRFARAASRATGHPMAFGVALAAVVGWAIAGPLFGFSNTWQLVINTATTVVTFLVVFVIQSTQNRDAEAMQLKLDELIRASRPAHNALLDIEELSEEELDAIKARFEKLARKARKLSRSEAASAGTETTHKHSRNGRHRTVTPKAEDTPADIVRAEAGNNGKDEL